MMRWRLGWNFGWALAALFTIQGCGDDADDGQGDDVDAATPAVTFEPQAEDFECLSNWTKVGRYYLTNKLGMLDEAVAVAEDPDGGTFPVGTIIQLVPFEAMVKREAGFSPDTGDWEFFFLSVDADGTTIDKRGTADVENQFGGNCLDCHRKADARFDFVCGTDHGCDPLPLTIELIESLQQSDARCD